MLDAAIGKGVIESRRKVKRKKRCPEYGKPHHPPDIPIIAGIKDQRNQSDDRKDRPGPMGHAVGDFLANAVLGYGFSAAIFSRPGVHRSTLLKPKSYNISLRYKPSTLNITKNSTV